MFVFVQNVPVGTKRPRDITRPICLSRIVFLHVMLGDIGEKLFVALHRFLYTVPQFYSAENTQGNELTCPAFL